MLQLTANGTNKKVVATFWTTELETPIEAKIRQKISPGLVGYGRRLMRCRSWVRIPAPYTRWSIKKIRQGVLLPLLSSPLLRKA